MTQPIRHDILSLNEEKLIQLTNAGLVKRASKALDNGDIPLFTLTDESLISKFSDEHHVVWRTGNSITDTECTCPAPMCRHRVQTVLAYRQSHDNPSVTVTSPHEIEREQIDKLANATLIKRAKILCKHGLTIKLTPMQEDQCASAVLPMATVKFWGGANLFEATCDCVHKQHCEHILLASLAYQSLDSEPKQSMDIIIDSQQIEQFFSKTSVKTEEPSATKIIVDTDTQTPHLNPMLIVDNLTQAEVELWSALLEDGATAGLLRYQRLLDDVSTTLVKSKEIWLESILTDLKHWLMAYEKRRTDFDSDRGFELLSEYTLRSLARQNQALHNTVLGIGLSHETPIATARLISVGCRISQAKFTSSQKNDNDWLATTMLFDNKTQTLLSYQHPFSLSSALDKKQQLQRIQNLRLSAHISLQQLATGQLTCQQASRLANHQLILRTSRKNYNQILPQQGDWTAIARSSQLQLAHQRQLPMFLQGRYQQPNFVVIALTKILHHGYDPANQRYIMVGKDASDNEWLVYRQYHTSTPFALHAIATALNQATVSQTINQESLLCYVAGTMTSEQGKNSLEAWSIVTDKLYVLDVDDSVTRYPHVLKNAPTLYLANPTVLHNSVEQALLDFKNHCSQRLITGRHQQTFGQFIHSLMPYANRFKQLGLGKLSEDLTVLLNQDRSTNTPYLLIKIMAYLRLCIE